MTFIPQIANTLLKNDSGVDEPSTTNYIVAHALTAEGHDASEDGTGRGTPLVAAPLGVSTSASVRRLTPTECERLQGFPDGWTDLGGTPDSRRYAALGDAVTVPVAEWIGRRIRSSA